VARAYIMNFVLPHETITGRFIAYRLRSILSGLGLLAYKATNMRRVLWQQLDQKAYGREGLSFINKVPLTIDTQLDIEVLCS
jgi:hypothetical protein